MVTAFTGAFNLFKDAGLSVATVQRAKITDAQVSNLFWVNMLVGGALALVCVVMGPLLAGFYHEPRLFWIAATLGTGFVFNAAGVQHSALLQRQMRFVALATIDVLSCAVSLILSIAVASAGYAHWAIVCMTVSLPAVYSTGNDFRKHGTHRGRRSRDVSSWAYGSRTPHMGAKALRSCAGLRARAPTVTPLESRQFTECGGSSEVLAPRLMV